MHGTGSVPALICSCVQRNRCESRRYRNLLARDCSRSPGSTSRRDLGYCGACEVPELRSLPGRGREPGLQGEGTTSSTGCSRGCAAHRDGGRDFELTNPPWRDAAGTVILGGMQGDGFRPLDCSSMMASFVCVPLSCGSDPKRTEAYSTVPGRRFIAGRPSWASG